MDCRFDFPRPGSPGRECLRFANPVERLVARTLAEVPGVVARAWALAQAGRWVAGFVAYEAAPAFDPALAVRAPDAALPLAAFAAYEAPVPDGAEGEGAVGEGAADHPFACGPWRPSTARSAALAAVERVREGIAAGDHYQVNLTTQLRAGFDGDAGALFDALRAAQPDGYCAMLDGADWRVLSVSPELFFDWTPDGTLETRPMKGTAPRGATPEADAAAARALRASEKERAENLMIVDLMRNDLARVAATGSVRVPSLFELQALPTAWQMISVVQATTRPGTTLPDVFTALFPCGSVTGAPKVAAMKAIAALEDAPRGAYCGAIGLVRPGGHATFNVGIRTVTLHGSRASATRATCGVGSGITIDSDPAAEWDEWLVKRRFLLRASAGFELLETLRLEAGQSPACPLPAYPLLARHLDRLADAARHFGFPLDVARVHAALATAAAEAPAGTWRVRLLVDRTGRARAERHPMGETPAEAVVALAASPVDADDEFLRFKTTHRAAYDAHPVPPGAFDVLLWNARGELTEFTRGNLVLELDGRRVTPPVRCGLLPGTLRAELLARGALEERVLVRGDLARATRAWFVNGLRGEVPVRLPIVPG